MAFFIAAYGEPFKGAEIFHTCHGGKLGCIRPSHLDIAPQGTAVRLARGPSIGRERRMEFARKIRRERMALNLTQAEFGRELGIKARTVSSWELGERAPHIDRYRELAAKFGWDGKLRRFTVLVALERTVEAASAKKAAAAVLAALEVDGRPQKAQVIRTVARR